MNIARNQVSFIFLDQIMDDHNHWKELQSNIYYLINKKETNKKVCFNIQRVQKLKYISIINMNHIRIGLMFNKKIIIARLNTQELQIKNIVTYCKFQKYLLFAQNVILWIDHNLKVSNTWRSKNIRVFKLIDFHKVPYELKKLVPQFINIKQFCSIPDSQNYIMEKISNIFQQTFKINTFNQQLEYTKQIRNFYIQQYTNRSQFQLNNMKHVQNHSITYYIDSDYVKTSNGICGKLKNPKQIDILDIQKFKDSIQIFYSIIDNNFIYLKQIHTKQKKIMKFDTKKYTQCPIFKIKFFQNNIILRETIGKLRVFVISIFDQLSKILIKHLFISTKLSHKINITSIIQIFLSKTLSILEINLFLQTGSSIIEKEICSNSIKLILNYWRCLFESMHYQRTTGIGKSTLIRLLAQLKKHSNHPTKYI
ncbi:hypothetical protein pb186bvf_020132 [Paramecium bursaria]